jgi:hypothetical protein
MDQYMTQSSAILNRRICLQLISSTAILGAGLRTVHAQATLDTDPSTLQPGQFIWQPERSPTGPVAIIVSIPRQLTFVYRNGILIGISTCSTGKPGHATPMGVFTILQKAKTHTSSTYDEAMPDMQRLTWQGIALHVGDLPGYPSSHGCVHLPTGFADPLFGATHVGTPVIIAGHHTDPVDVADPGPILGTSAESEIAGKAGEKAVTEPKTSVMSILVSRADQKIYVLVDATIVAEGNAIIKDPEQPLGSNVFVWQGGDAAGSTWQGMGFQSAPVDVSDPKTSTLERIDGAADVMNAIRSRLKPGTVLATTDLPANADTRSLHDFTIVDSQPPQP